MLDIRGLRFVAPLAVSMALVAGPHRASAAPPVPPPPATPEPPQAPADDGRVRALEDEVRQLIDQTRGLKEELKDTRKSVAELRAAETARHAAEAKKREEAAQAEKAAKKAAAEKSASDDRIPFSGIDSTWVNGQSKQKTFPLGSWADGAITPSVFFEAYYAYSNNHPKDDGLTGTATVGRHNELQVNLAGVGVDWNYQNVIGRISVQFGSMLNIVQDQDGTTLKGRNLPASSLRYLREAVVGYHFDAGYGINLELGMFLSYIGLESYNLSENWNFNRSFLSDFTPFYFTGLRAQFFPSKYLKIEPWLMNGYQTFGKWNQAPAAGLALKWSPKEWLSPVANFYLGTDTKNEPDRLRFHHDDSIVLRYYDSPKSMGVSKAAFSLNNHAGFEHGGNGPPTKDAYMIGAAIANRVWFFRDHLALVARFEVAHHPSGYTVAYPPPGFAAGNDFSMWGLTGTIEIMPTDFFSIRPEIMYRAANVPFFAGPNGTTSQTGYLDGSTAGFVPDVRKTQLLGVLGASFRL